MAHPRSSAQLSHFIGQTATELGGHGAREHLRPIRGRVDQIADDVVDLKHRIPGLETSMVLVKREVTASDETDVRLQMSLDKIVERIR